MDTNRPARRRRIERPKLQVIAALLVAALLLHAPGWAADWSKPRLFRDTWSAARMLDAPVRDERGRPAGEVSDIVVGLDGRVHRVIAEVGGVLEIGDQHLGIPWGDLRIGPRLEWVQAPLEEVRDGTYALHGVAPQGERVADPPASWRVSQRIGRPVEDVEGERGVVTDVIFDDGGFARGLVVDRGDGTYAYLELDKP